MTQPSAFSENGKIQTRSHSEQNFSTAVEIQCTCYYLLIYNLNGIVGISNDI